MLAVRGLRKSYGDQIALEGVDLNVSAGEICGLLGPNGAGKTTLVSIITGLRHADAGSVTVNGIDARVRSDEARRFIGLAPQDLGIYPTLSVRQNLTFFGELADIWGRTLRQRIEEISEVFELTGLLDRSCRQLSGGEKRRLHTAAAMLHRPPLLLLDEPTTGVDVRTRARILEAVRRLATEQGCAVCYSTHYLPEIETMGASVAIIDKGQIIARGSVAELVERHARAAVELSFDGRAPTVDYDGHVENDGSMLRVYTNRPTVEAAAILDRLGEAAHRLRAVEIVAPSLESVFLALTGRRYASEEDGSPQLEGRTSDVAT